MNSEYLHPVYKFQPSFGRRKSRRIEGERAELMEHLFPTLHITPPKDSSKINLNTYFDTTKEIWLEIGFGAGEHLASQATNNPDIGFIGCEPFIDGVAKLLVTIDEQKLNNIKLFDDDARILLDALPDSCLSRIFVLFPDPWRKPRHYKRRIINPETLDMFARIMKKGGTLRLATDHQNYAEWMLEHMMADKRFEWQASEPRDWHTLPDDWVVTRYNEKANEEGRTPYIFNFILY